MMEKAERCEQALHVYGPPFRHGKEKEKEREWWWSVRRGV